MSPKILVALFKSHIRNGNINSAIEIINKDISREELLSLGNDKNKSFDILIYAIDKNAGAVTDALLKKCPELIQINRLPSGLFINLATSNKVNLAKKIIALILKTAPFTKPTKEDLGLAIFIAAKNKHNEFFNAIYRQCMDIGSDVISPAIVSDLLRLAIQSKNQELFCSITAPLVNYIAGNKLTGQYVNHQDPITLDTPLVACCKQLGCLKAQQSYSPKEETLLIEFIHALISLGADPAIKNNRGFNALDMAKLLNNNDVMSLFNKIITKQSLKTQNTVKTVVFSPCQVVVEDSAAASNEHKQPSGNRNNIAPAL